MTPKKENKPSYLDIIAKAKGATSETEVQPIVSEESSNTIKPETQKDGKPEIKLVNLTIKVHPQRRDFWAVEAKKKRTSMTAAMIKGLIEEFGNVNTEND